MKNQIREYRKLRGLTMQQLADMVGVSLNAIYEYETNKYQPRADVIDKLLLFLGCSFDQLFIREAFKQLDFDDYLNDSHFEDGFFDLFDHSEYFDPSINDCV